jgi:putative heme-binding domain-containing protein
MPDGRGHNRDRLAPGGIVYRFSPDGKEWEAGSGGYRNIYDGGFNKDGELFTYDADMEYDFNTPWYRPTRVNHVTSGSEYGWRNGTGKRQEWLPDNLPPAINIGPGSPTGATFGYGAKFPAKYQEAFYCLDWSWGKLYAVTLEPNGSSYKATKEEFLSGTPLPLTDAIIHPGDGAMYFAIGGRKVQSGLYRVTYTGAESTSLVEGTPSPLKVERQLRQKLEDLHRQRNPEVIKQAWPYLDHTDKFIRWAARIALEHQPVDQWEEKALKEKDGPKRVEALLGLVRAAGIDPVHRKPSDPPVRAKLRNRILASLNQVDWAGLDLSEQLTLIRTYQIAFIRFGKPGKGLLGKTLARLDPLFPASRTELNAVLCETLVYLQSPTVAAKTIPLMQEAPTQEEQMEYARSLRMLKTGWNNELRTAYFNWFLKAANYRGGASFEKFIEFIRNDAVATLTPKEQEDLRELLAKKPEKKSPLEALAEALAGRSFVKEWTLDELAGEAEGSMKNRDFEKGHKMFGAVACFACHRFDNQGGMTGPDLTGASGRYSTRDLLDQIIHPSKEINEQFVPVVLTLSDGDAITGTIVNLNGNTVSVNTDPANPNQQERVDRNKVVKIETATVSPMPEGLLNMLEKEEIMDLLAYILSGGNAENAMFSRQ